MRAGYEVCSSLMCNGVMLTWHSQNSAASPLFFFCTCFLKPHGFLLFITACTQSLLEKLAVDLSAGHAGIQTLFCFCFCCCCCQAFLCIVCCWHAWFLYWRWVIAERLYAVWFIHSSMYFCVSSLIFSSFLASEIFLWYVFEKLHLCVTTLWQLLQRMYIKSAINIFNVFLWEIEARQSFLKRVDHLDKMTKPLPLLACAVTLFSNSCAGESFLVGCHLAHFIVVSHWISHTENSFKMSLDLFLKQKPYVIL